MACLPAVRMGGNAAVQHGNFGAAANHCHIAEEHSEDYMLAAWSGSKSCWHGSRCCHRRPPPRAPCLLVFLLSIPNTSTRWDRAEGWDQVSDRGRICRLIMASNTEVALHRPDHRRTWRCTPLPPAAHLHRASTSTVLHCCLL